MTNFNQLDFKPVAESFGKGVQAIIHFPNGFGASVISHDFSYGGKAGLFELAVLDKHNNILSNTDITDDVIGWQDEGDIDRLLFAISQLDSDGVLPSNVKL